MRQIESRHAYTARHGIFTGDGGVRCYGDDGTSLPRGGAFITALLFAFFFSFCFALLCFALLCFSLITAFLTTYEGSPPIYIHTEMNKSFSSFLATARHGPIFFAETRVEM